MRPPRSSDEPNADIAPDGTVYGIEPLRPNEQLIGTDGGALAVVDEADGRARPPVLGLIWPDARAPRSGPSAF